MILCVDWAQLSSSHLWSITQLQSDGSWDWRCNIVGIVLISVWAGCIFWAAITRSAMLSRAQTITSMCNLHPCYHGFSNSAVIVPVLETNKKGWLVESFCFLGCFLPLPWWFLINIQYKDHHNLWSPSMCFSPKPCP